MMRNFEKMMEFGEKLHNIRISKNLSQEELAERTGISRRSIQNYESGKMLPKKRETYAVLAEALGVEEPVLQYGSTAMRQAMDLVADVKALWAGGEMEEEDMDEIMRALQEAYHEAKQRHHG